VELPDMLFKVTYINNEIASCNVSPSLINIKGPYATEFYPRFLIYALIKAADKEAAMKIGNEIARDFVLSKL